MDTNPVRVPKEAGLGKAKITLLIPGSKAPPSIFELPVVDAAPEGKK